MSLSQIPTWIGLLLTSEVITHLNKQELVEPANFRKRFGVLLADLPPIYIE